MPADNGARTCEADQKLRERESPQHEETYRQDSSSGSRREQYQREDITGQVQVHHQDSQSWTERYKMCQKKSANKQVAEMLNSS